MSINTTGFLYFTRNEKALNYRFNRLPLPPLSLLDNIAHAREGKMESLYQRPLGCNFAEKFSSC